MFDYHVITRERHTNKSWQKPHDYRFTQQDHIVALAASEIPTAMAWFPVGFMRHNGGYQPIAIQGLQTGQNLLTNSQGQWLADYIPAAYRGYPFKLVSHGENDYVCIDEQSGLLLNDASGEPFFDDDGAPSPLLSEYMRFHSHLKADLENGRKLGEILSAHELLEEWVLTEAEAAGSFRDLLRVSEARLNALSADSLKSLRDSGALLLAYCQLLSMQNVKQLKKLAAQRSPNPSAVPNGTFDTNATISFANLD